MDSRFEGKPSVEPLIRLKGIAQSGASGKEGSMWLALAFIFLIAWLIAFLAFHVAVAAIHILLALFVIFLIVHFIRRAAHHA